MTAPDDDPDTGEIRRLVDVDTGEIRRVVDPDTGEIRRIDAPAEAADTGSDTGAGTGSDTGSDTGPDAGPDTVHDSGRDSGQDTVGPADQPPAGPGSGRSRLVEAIRPRATRAQLLAAALCAVLGFALVVQLQQTGRSGLAGLRQNDLIGILDQATARNTELEQEAQQLLQQREALRRGTDAGAAAEEVATQRLEALQILSGTRAVTGPGIRLEIDDPDRKVPASTVLDMVEELRDAGAEAIQIGDVRVVAGTAFLDDPAGDGIVVGSTTLRAPYTVLVIGDPDSLSTALNIPGGVVEVLKSQNATPRISEQSAVQVTALHEVRAAKYARPAPAASP